MNAFTDRQTEIIKAAIGIIAEKGIQVLTIKNLAKKVEISEPALYRHFKNKTAILLGILRFFQDRSYEIFKAILNGIPAGRLQVAAVIEEHCRHFTTYPAFAAVMYSEVLFRNEPKLAKAALEHMDKARANITSILEAGIAAGEFRKDVPMQHLLITVMGSLRLLVSQWHLSGYAFDLAAAGKDLAASLNAMLQVK